MGLNVHRLTVNGVGLWDCNVKYLVTHQSYKKIKSQVRGKSLGGEKIMER